MAFADVEDLLDATLDTLLAAGATGREAPRQVAPVRGYACSQMPTDIRSACAGIRGRTGAVAAVASGRSGPSGLRGEPAWSRVAQPAKSSTAQGQWLLPLHRSTECLSVLTTFERSIRVTHLRQRRRYVA